MLSLTPEGKQWLSQFDQPDEETATLLLDSLVLVDQTDFENGLEKVIDDFLASHEGNIAL